MKAVADLDQVQAERGSQGQLPPSSVNLVVLKVEFKNMTELAKSQEQNYQLKLS